ncbi:hypothetical protein MKEN_00319400 [Mycena kentingensis (nom. inval.)]|nr:hypothetical protein MKEN_00319400 [Mycena kentingensis (nom. inval.)]
MGMSADCDAAVAVVEDTPFLPLLAAVFTSILEVFLLCLAGYILAGKGILDKRTQKQLNRLNVSLFTPCLLFSKVAFFLSPEKLGELWIIPLFFAVVTLVSMSTAYVVASLFRLKRSQRNFDIASAMFMNSNSLPIALMQALVASGSVSGLKWGPNDNKNAMLGRALTYLVLYSTLGMVLRWSYGVRLLAQADEEVVAKPDDEEQSALPRHRDGHAFPSNEGTLRPTSLADPEACSPGVPVVISPRDFLKSGHGRRQSRFYASFPNSPNQSRLVLPPDGDTQPNSSDASPRFASPEGSDTESDGEAETAPLILPQSASSPAPGTNARRPSHARQVSTYSQFSGTGNATLRRARRKLYRAWVKFNEFMTVPLWAAAASLIVACVGPLQHALDEHMQPVKGALTSAGNCSIPLTLIVLGGYFYPEPPVAKPTAAAGPVGPPASASDHTLLESVREMFGKQQQRIADGTAPPARQGETLTVVIAVVSRMILTPMLLLPLMAVFTKYDLHRVFEDPVFVVANVLLLSSPPALTLAQITQAASGDAFERLISRTIFWSYCVVTPPATIVYVILGLMLSKL